MYYLMLIFPFHYFLFAHQSFHLYEYKSLTRTRLIHERISKYMLNTMEIFFCFSIHKKLNKSCFLDKLFLFLKKKIVSLKKSFTLAKRHFLDFSGVYLTKWVDFLAFISRFACDKSDFVEIFFFRTLPPRFF